ncbi:MAG: HEAT repeat domain-containing protein [Anaerolineae bacterium]
MGYSHEAIRRRLLSTRLDDRRVAAIMIGKSRQYEYVPELMHLLEADTSADVRSMAAFALDLLGSAEAIPALITALYDSSFDVRNNAGWALVNIATRIMPQLVLPDMIDILRDESHAHARQMAYLVLSNIPHDDARSALDQYWN